MSGASSSQDASSGQSLQAAYPQLKFDFSKLKGALWDGVPNLNPRQNFHFQNLLFRGLRDEANKSEFSSYYEQNVIPNLAMVNHRTDALVGIVTYASRGEIEKGKILAMPLGDVQVSSKFENQTETPFDIRCLCTTGTIITVYDEDGSSFQKKLVFTYQLPNFYGIACPRKANVELTKYMKVFRYFVKLTRDTKDPSTDRKWAIVAELELPVLNTIRSIEKGASVTVDILAHLRKIPRPGLLPFEKNIENPAQQKEFMGWQHKHLYYKCECDEACKIYRVKYTKHDQKYWPNILNPQPIPAEKPKNLLLECRSVFYIVQTRPRKEDEGLTVADLEEDHPAKQFVLYKSLLKVKGVFDNGGCFYYLCEEFQTDKWVKYLPVVASYDKNIFLLESEANKALESTDKSFWESIMEPVPDSRNDEWMQNGSFCTDFLSKKLARLRLNFQDGDPEDEYAEEDGEGEDKEEEAQEEEDEEEEAEEEDSGDEDEEEDSEAEKVEDESQIISPEQLQGILDQMKDSEEEADSSSSQDRKRKAKAPSESAAGAASSDQEGPRRSARPRRGQKGKS